MSVFTEFAQGRSKLQRQIDELRQKSSDADSELRRAQEQRREVSKRPASEAGSSADSAINELQRESQQLKNRYKQAQEWRAKLLLEEHALR